MALLFSLGIAGVTSGCAFEPLGSKSRAVVGELAPEVTSVFQVEAKPFGVGKRCSAVLVSETLLLTAAHCVTNAPSVPDCASTKLGAPLPVDGFRLSNEVDLRGAAEPSWTYYAARKIHLPVGEEALLCGHDWALFELSEPPDNAVPVERVELALPPLAAEFSALGYGAGSPSGTGEGARRVRMGQRVECLEEECDGTMSLGIAGALTTVVEDVASGEFLGSAGACPGDSGGPALTSDGRVLGIASRGHENCSAPIYAVPDETLAAVVRKVTTERGEPIPSWAEKPLVSGTGGAVSSAGSSGGAAGDFSAEQLEEPEETGGCSIGAARTPRGFAGGAFFLGVLGVFLVRRRRAKEGGRSALRGRAGNFSTRPLVLGALGVFTTACAITPVDTEGRRFASTCEGGHCSLALLTKDSQEKAEPLFEVNDSSRILTVCPSGKAAADECRPLLCEGGRVCSSLGTGGFSCEKGLCQATERPLGARDLVALCLAGKGSETNTMRAREGLSLARAAQIGKNPPFSVPEDCRAP